MPMKGYRRYGLWESDPHKLGYNIVIYTHLSQCLLIELSSASITFIDERRCETVKEWALFYIYVHIMFVPAFEDGRMDCHRAFFI